MKTKTYFSEFRSDIAVAILGKDDYRYEVMKSLFEMYGFGFAETSSGCVFIDGEMKLTKDELRWVEAHEVAHIILKHKMGDRNTEDEFMADVYASRILLEMGYIKAAELISKHSIERHGNQI
jgi:hypothetical protein